MNQLVTLAGSPAPALVAAAGDRAAASGSMDWGALIGPAVVAAVVSGIISVVSMFVSRATTVRLHSEKLDADRALAERKVQADIDLAREKFEYGRRQAVFHRRFELAEQFLADVYRLRSMMRFVRSGASFGGEGETRTAPGAESEAVKRTRDSYFVPRERLHAENEFLGAMFARQTTCHAHFGADADKAFTLLHEAIHRVRTSSSLLVEWTGDHERVDRDLMEKLRRDIWQPMAEHAGKDEIGDKIEEAVQIVEGLCQPVLAWVDGR